MFSMNKVLKTSGILASLLTLVSACAPRSALQQSTSLDFDSGIIGGNPVDAQEEMAKSTVAIGTMFSGNFCTGTLVAKNLVVTAAHCTGLVRDPRMMIILFGSDLSKKNSIETRKVLGGQVPDAWPALTEGQTKDEGDVALLKFEGEAPAGFKPMRLLGNPEQLIAGMDVTLVGYGLTNMDPETDPKKLMKAAVKLSNPTFAKTEILFEQHEGRGACHGDSGGPAFAVINQKTFLIGVTSRSITEAGGNTCLEGSIYSSVAGQIEFLKKAARYLNSAQFVPGKPIPQPKLDSEPQGNK
jgi:secreted trypsin-like serine protease